MPALIVRKEGERLEPLGNKVIVRRDPKPDKAGRILIADAHQQQTYLGTVEAVGPGLPVTSSTCPNCMTKNTTASFNCCGYRVDVRPCRVKVGDRVILPELGGQEIKDWDGGEPIVIIEDDFLHGRVV